VWVMSHITLYICGVSHVTHHTVYMWCESCHTSHCIYVTANCRVNLIKIEEDALLKTLTHKTLTHKTLTHLMCDMTTITYISVWCVTWLTPHMYPCDAWHDSHHIYIRVMRDMTHTTYISVWCVTWLTPHTYQCDIVTQAQNTRTHDSLHVWHDSTRCVTWLIHTRHDSFMCVWHEKFMSHIAAREDSLPNTLT